VSALVYVHGTNGSGKSTLARSVVAAAGGSVGEENTPLAYKAKAFTTYSNEGVLFLGRYGNACGGLDGYSPYAAVLDVLAFHRNRDLDLRVFAEGLITPGVDTCLKLAGFFDETHFIHLDTPVEDCIKHVMARRKRKGNDKPYDPANLYKKAQSAESWAKRLKNNGMDVHTLDYRAAYKLTLAALGLDSPSVDDLLS
jgi:hypothetical protein